jgi:hypothetical protein
MARSIAEMIAPQVSESDATMVDVYGLKSQAADNMAGAHSVLAGLGMIPAVGNVADAVDTMLYLSEGDVGGAGLSALSALPFAGLLAGGLKNVKGMRQLGKFNRQLNDPDYLYKKHGIQRGGQQQFKRGEADFLDPDDFMSKRAKKAANKAEAKEMKKMQEEIAKDPKGFERKMQKEMDEGMEKMERERLIREEEDFFNYGKEGFEGGDY